MWGGIRLDRELIIFDRVLGRLDGVFFIIAIGVVVVLLLLIALIVVKCTQKKKNINVKPVVAQKADEKVEIDLPMKIINVHNIGRRESQQDSFAVSPLKIMREKGILALVADGMGGLEGGAESSNKVANYLLSEFKKYQQIEGNRMDHPDLLLRMVNDANDILVDYLEQSNIERGGTTLVATVIKDNLMHFLSVGDSKIIIYRGGAITTINRPHTYGSDLDEMAARGEISYQEAKEDSQRAALTSFVGMGKLEHIDRNVEPIVLVPGDKVVLMSDGVFGFIDDSELITILNIEDVYQAAEELEGLILMKNNEHQDNFTAIIIEIEE